MINKTYPNPLIISIISSQLDADRLDYLLRDAYFTGAPYGEIDVERILRTMRVVNNKIVYKVSGMHAIEDYLMSRYQMYWQVYLHSTGRSFDLVIQNMLRRVREKFTVLLNGYLPVPDVNEYIVTPAVSGNGSATLGNFALAKDVADKHANK